MEKKDLVIGKKYLHKGNREVYYLGESKTGDSIVQPTNGINGIVSLKACHPELKDIIGNDKFWGYFNMHLELSEIEPKFDDLKDNVIYFCKSADKNLTYLFKYNSRDPYNCAGIYTNLSSLEHKFCNEIDGINFKDKSSNETFMLTNQEQKDWLNNCIKANKFVPKDYVKEIPKYVSSNCPDFYKVGDYVITEGYSGDYDEKVLKINKIDKEFCYFDIFHDFCDYDSSDNFDISMIKRLATSEEIEKAIKNKRNIFEAGKWYRYSANHIKKSIYAKYSSNQSVVNRFYYDEIITEENGYKKGHNWSTLTCIPILLTDLSEIQKFLPEGHPDKVVKEFVLPEKWYCKVTNDNLKFFKSLKQYSHLNLGDWSSIIDGNTGRDTCNLDKNYVEITFEQFKQYVLKQKGKPIEKWSIGSYVVFISKYGCSEVGDIDLIVEGPNSKDTIIQCKHELTTTTDENYIKWFATLEEAQKFSDTLKNKETMNYKFKVGDRVKVVKTGYGTADIHEPFVTITSLGTYSGKPGYSVEPKIGNSFSGACNGMIGEESFELYEEKPIQDKKWVSLEDWEAETRKLNLDVYDLADYIKSHKVSVEIYNMLPGVFSDEKASLLISKWNKDDFKVGDWVVGWYANYPNYKNNAWQVLRVEGNYLYASTNLNHVTGAHNVRKALPHEIPNQNNPGVGSEVFNIDFNEVKVGHCDTFMGMKIYGHIAYPPLQPQYKWTFRNYSPKNDGLDLSLRDEKEMNVNEIKSSNNNISKLNLSLNN